MDYEPIHEVGRRKPNPKNLPIGVMITYYPDETEELEHLVSFLKAHFEITEEDLGNKRRAPHWRAHQPFLRIGDKQVSLCTLITRAPFLHNEMGIAAVGFMYPTKKHPQYAPHIPAFHAYKAHLDADKNPGLEPIRELYRKVAAEFFPSGVNLH